MSEESGREGGVEEPWVVRPSKEGSSKLWGGRVLEPKSAI